MTFYEPCLDAFDAPHKIYADMKESEKGTYATRADAEQAAKDAVEMAKIVKFFSDTPAFLTKAQAIIERYEGGKG